MWCTWWVGAVGVRWWGGWVAACTTALSWLAATAVAQAGYPCTAPTSSGIWNQASNALLCRSVCPFYPPSCTSIRAGRHRHTALPARLHYLPAPPACLPACLPYLPSFSACLPSFLSPQDIKSANILLTATGTAKLADVGFAKQKQNTFLSDVPLVGTFAW